MSLLTPGEIKNAAQSNLEDVIKELADQIYQQESIQAEIGPGNATATTIGTVSTWTKIAGDLTETISSSGLAVDTAADEINYTERPDKKVLVRVELEATNGGAAAKSCDFGLAINGTVQGAVQQQEDISDTSLTRLVFSGIVTISEGDTLDFQVQNNDDTVDVTVDQLKATITEV